MRIVHERAFGGLSAQGEVMAARAGEFLTRGISPDGPVTYVQGSPPWVAGGEGFAGAIIHAVPHGAGVWEVEDGGQVVGRGWKRGGASFVVLQNIGGQGAAGASRPAQSEDIIRRAGRILELNGASFRDVVRTWFYLSDILSWYGGFNAARNGLYEEFGL
ncbi:MAG TPA: hypothetical protein VJM83_04135, partial [Nitrospirota bacterium]|nr:hypothetical protein [Nitrospirota bacterium]